MQLHRNHREALDERDYSSPAADLAKGIGGVHTELPVERGHGCGESREQRGNRVGSGGGERVAGATAAGRAVAL